MTRILLALGLASLGIMCGGCYKEQAANVKISEIRSCTEVPHHSIQASYFVSPRGTTPGTAQLIGPFEALRMHRRLFVP